MAARLRKTHQDDVRLKIQASQIINRLQAHLSGEVELSATQLRAAEILLKKSVPDLSAIELSNPEDEDFRVSVVTRQIVDAKT